MKRLWIVILICTCCLATTRSGQTQNAQPQGPVILEDARPTHQALVYTLRFLRVSGANSPEYVWFLQKQATVPLDGPIEPNETAFRSLNSLVLRDYVSHLPEGTHINHSPMMLPGPDPTIKVGGDSEPGLQDFVKFCRSKKIDFRFGVSF